MKKVLLLSIAICCLMLVSNAQETVLFTGDQTTSMFSRMDMIDWALTETLENERYVNFGTAEAPEFSEITDNPDKTGLNSSDMALHMSSLKGHSWWPDFLVMTLAEPLTVTEDTRYLHMYHYRENQNKGFSVWINEASLPEDPDKGTKRFDMDLKKAGEWEDVVVDLKWYIDNQEPVNLIGFLVDRNWSGEEEPATNYYWDEIVLNDSNLPRGINLFTEKSISIDLGNDESVNQWVDNIDTQNEENTYEIVDNPFTDQTTDAPFDKIMQFNKSANAAWWQGARFALNGSLPVGADGSSAYLHVFVNIQDMEAGNDYYVIQLNAKDFAGNEIDSGDALKYWSDDAGYWVDMVMDVTSLGYVSEFTVRFDVRRDADDNYVSSPAGVFYIDDIAINDSEDQRDITAGNTAVNENKLEDVKVYAYNSNLIVEGNVATVEVFNMLGSRLGKYLGNGNRTEIPVQEKGVYLVKTVTKDHTVSKSKVLVK